MKIPFDIKYRPQIESGEYKVVTRGGQPVRILCYDRKGKFNIIALVDNGDIEIKQEYASDGCILYDKSAHRLDLFVITSEPELTEFEKHVQAVMMNSGLVGCTECYKDIDTVKTTAKSLLESAKTELQPKYDATKVDEALIEKMVSIKKKRNPQLLGMALYRDGLTDMYKQFAEELEAAFKYQDEVVYNQGYVIGQSDALKDLPHWTPTTELDGIYDYPNRLVWEGYQIDIAELIEKLPKDEQD